NRTRALSLGINGSYAAGGDLTCDFGLVRWMAPGLWEPYLTAVVRSAGHGWGTRAGRQAPWGACSGWAGGSERDDAGLGAAELGHVVAVGGQEGEGVRLAQGDLGVDAVLVPAQPSGRHSP